MLAAQDTTETSVQLQVATQKGVDLNFTSTDLTLSLDDFSRGAALAAQWTKDVIRPETREFLLSLKPEGNAQGVGLFHASPRDPIWEYVLSGLTAELCFDVTDFRISLIGHSHVALSFDRQEGSPASGTTRKEGTELDLGAGQWLINPGSTGQPRDGDPRAAWLMRGRSWPDPAPEGLAIFTGRGSGLDGPRRPWEGWRERSRIRRARGPVHAADSVRRWWRPMRLRVP